MVNQAQIIVKNLTKSFSVNEKESGLSGSIKSFFRTSKKTITAVDNISFDINQGEIVGFIGKNGAGKTTTLKILSGLLHPTSGTAQVFGFTPWERKTDFLKQFSIVMGQKSQLWWDLPPIETFQLNKALFSIPEKHYKKTLNHLVSILQVENILHTQVRKLSLGQRMKCELIASLLHSPRVLLLDEPTIGLDVVMQKTLRDFIKIYNQEFQATIILTSHYMDDVKQLCQRTLIIDEGKLLYDGSLSGLIDKYAHSKIISMVFSKDVTLQQVKQIGQIKEFAQDGSAQTATVIVSKKEATNKASQAFKLLPVADITIQEAPLEAIIRDVFLDLHSNKKLN